MLARLKAAIIVLLVLAWPDLGAAQSCVQSGIAAGGDHTCAFTVGGSVVCWGEDQFGQLGNGAFFVATQVPVVVTDPSGQPLGGLRKIAAGYFHTCAISGTCVASACYCPPGRTLCPPSGSSARIPRPTPTTAANAAQVCSGGRTCVNSDCVCPPGLTSCRGRCVDLQTDNNNCGSCGHHCRFRPPCNRVESGCETCENGECVSF